MIDGDCATLVDIDTLAAGEAALDVANFLVHLDLRVTLGLDMERARATAEAFIGAYRPPPEVARRLAAHATMTRVPGPGYSVRSAAAVGVRPAAHAG